MSLEKDLPKLLDAGIISEETAEKIRGFYQEQKGNSQSRMFMAFGILGALLVGLGIILIIAHNWDDLSRSTKTSLSFLPLILGQLACIWTLVKKSDSPAWREGSSTFLFFANGAAISLISQIYHVQGELDGFMFIWMLLCIPQIYLMRSSMTSLLCLIGITTFGVTSGYEWKHSMSPHYFWLLFASVLPHYYILIRKHKTGNFLILHHWFTPLALIITLGIVASRMEEYLLIAYTSLFGFYFLVGKHDLFKGQILRNNSYFVMGALGTLFMMFMMSFEDAWPGYYEYSTYLSEFYLSVEFYTALLISGAATYLLIQFKRSNEITSVLPLGASFLVFIPLFFLNIELPIGAILINIWVLALGIWIVRNGANKDHLGELNFGLVIIAILITCRFFDTDLSFVMRGILFLLVGIGFFGTNYWMLKKRKADEK